MLNNKRIGSGLLILAWAFFLSGCATYQNELRDSVNLIRLGMPAQAASTLKERSEKDGDNQVLYLLEYATAQQLAKNYAESNKAFLKAEELTDVKDYHSISRLTGSFILNEGMVQYKGEDYEKVFINAELAINFLMENNLEAAQVETRKLNDKLYKYKYEAKLDYQQNPFAFYLSALIWEENRQWDDAYIDYKKTYEVDPNIPYLKRDLIRAARKAQRSDELAKWKKEFKEVTLPDTKGKGEVVLILQQGWGPRKQPHPQWVKVPKLYPVDSFTRSARLVIDGVGSENSQSISSVERVAIKTLDDAYAELIAKRVAGVAAKAVISDQVRQKNELLGQLTWLGLNIIDQADLRQWVTLPQSFQVARMWVPPGNYKAYAEGLDVVDKPSGERSEDFEIKVVPDRKVFLHWRTLR